jgi:predicted DsbA family dithiol-disulfide isomerase
VKIQVWVDVTCPWCWLGKHHLEAALERAGIDADVEYMAFELDPNRTSPATLREYLTSKYGDTSRLDQAHGYLASAGSKVGLTYDFDRAVVTNTFAAHRLHNHAKSVGKGPPVMERLMRARQGEGADLSSPATLVRLAGEAGLSADEAARVIADPRARADEVRAEEEQARELGIHGVPYFVLDGRLGVSGAQPIDVLVEALREASKSK